VADGAAAHDHRGDDEQRDLQEPEKTGGLGGGGGRHRALWLAASCSPLSVPVACVLC